MKPQTVIVAVSFAIISALHAQQQNRETLAEMTSKAGLDWLAGEWVSKSADGSERTYSFSLILDGNAVKMEVAWGDVRQTGLIAYDPGSKQVKHLEVRNDGDFYSGVWTAEDGTAMLTFNWVNRYTGETFEMRTVYQKVDANTMAVTWMKLDRAGAPPTDSKHTVEFKRKK